MAASFRRTTLVRAAPQVVFDLSLSVEAHVASLAGSGERVVGGVTSGRLGLDQTVTWQARHFGVPWRMTSRIVLLDAPHRFVDEQVRGPFRYFRHLHEFVATAEGTAMSDEVELAAPGGPLGRLVERAFLTDYVAGLIDERNAYLADHADLMGR